MKPGTLVELYSEKNNQLLSDNQSLLFSLIPASVECYYVLLLEQKETAKFLTNDLVQTRLQSSLSEWMQQVLSPKDHEELAELLKRHHQIGEVHARINVNMSLVSEAMMVLKNSLHDGLMAQPNPKPQLLLLIQNIMDSALISINGAYFNDHEQMSHQSHILYNHLSSMDFALEIQQMRTLLHKWLSKSLINNQFDSVENSDFALWTRHKLPLAVHDISTVERIENLVNTLQEVTLNSDINSSATTDRLTQIINDLSWNLEELSKHLINSSEKKDPLTSVYNRRFLDTILLQETMRAQKMQKNYSIVMLDVDHFKSINDKHGHDVGDDVLAKLGETINHNIRVSDFAFRFGGEEFLILLTECSAQKALQITKNIKQAIQDIVFCGALNLDFTITFSAGIAEFDGQPDYEHTIKKADQSMYQSKENGRDRITIWNN